MSVSNTIFMVCADVVPQALEALTLSTTLPANSGFHETVALSPRLFIVPEITGFTVQLKDVAPAEEVE